MTDEQEYMRALGARVAELREAERWSQRALADEVGIARQTLRDIETGESRASVRMLFKLAVVLGVGVADMLPPAAPPETLDDIGLAIRDDALRYTDGADLAGLAERERGKDDG